MCSCSDFLFIMSSIGEYKVKQNKRGKKREKKERKKLRQRKKE